MLTNQKTMASQAKTSVILLLLLLLFTLSSSGCSSGVKDVVKLPEKQKEPLSKRSMVTIKTKARKLISANMMLDYYEGGANPVHDPGKGKGGKGGNNP